MYMINRKCSKVLNTSFSVLIMLLFWAGIYKMIVRIANRELTAPSEAV